MEEIIQKLWDEKILKKSAPSILFKKMFFLLKSIFLLWKIPFFCIEIQISFIFWQKSISFSFKNQTTKLFFFAIKIENEIDKNIVTSLFLNQMSSLLQQTMFTKDAKTIRNGAHYTGWLIVKHVERKTKKLIFFLSINYEKEINLNPNCEARWLFADVIFTHQRRF